MQRPADASASLEPVSPAHVKESLRDAATSVAGGADGDPADYALNHWRRYESDAAHALRVARAEEEAQALFRRATADETARYHDAISRLRGLHAPRHDRERAAALRNWREATTGARRLHLLTCDALMRDGEIPETLDRAWTALIDPARAKTLWG